ncbi:DUF4153 domain-containing protein [Qipengyuania qiaonensis]|uniref:DUF4153 domain-containing protein n=1 Tax=Qipengyuania qiaonensis TaxID=2867240 RepID=A0ABS7JAZ1_9SPHN|nr:DUF4153 domain-containing protein [Qipengyuania qiaonensis]MBX7483214.1 DUF4153 domain-containing protein [Qipengyuania qiaonensis]
MSDTADLGVPRTHADWPVRPWVLALLLGLAGLAIDFVADWDANDWAPWRAALTTAFAFGPLAFAFTLDRNRWKEPLVFAVMVALVMAGVAWRVALASETHVDAPFWMAAGIVAIALALPLFQAGFHRLRWRTPYDETHFHVWTDAISIAGAMAFVGLSWSLLFLLSQLFVAIEINLLEELIEESWFGWTFSGAAFGAALGVLRNQLKVIGTLQAVVMLVFSIIAVPLAIALAIFLLAVVASGISVLWNATESPTPLLLSVAVASFVLVNAVVRNGDAEASGNHVLRWAALALALAIFPLALLAAISTGTRIAEYGLSPERIWGVIAVAVAVAYGFAYFIAPIRGRMAGWMERVRTANLHLAVGTCVLALVLALPLFDFGAISARNQIARLESGKVAVDKFDFDALRWDFGDAGREALESLVKDADARIAGPARTALMQKQRPYRYAMRDDTRDERLANLRMEFEDPELRKAVRAYVRDTAFLCSSACVALDIGPAEARPGREIAFVSGNFVRREIVDPQNVPPEGAVQAASAIELGHDDAQPEVTAKSNVEIREWTGRRIYVDGKPLGEPFE